MAVKKLVGTAAVVSGRGTIVFSSFKRRLMPIAFSVLTVVAGIAAGVQSTGDAYASAVHSSSVPTCKYVWSTGNTVYKHTSYTPNPTRGSFDGLHNSILATDQGLTFTWSGYSNKFHTEYLQYTPQSTLKAHGGFVEWTGSGCKMTMALPGDNYVGTASLEVMSGGALHVDNVRFDLVAGSQGEPKPTMGYWLLGQNGTTYGYGTVAGVTSVGAATARYTVGLASDVNGQGYWVATSNGHVYQKNGAPFLGSPISQHVSVGNSIVAIASDPGCNGFWLATSNGVVYPFGCAQAQKGPAKLSSVIGIAAAPNGTGYWIATKNGHVYQYGAPFDGSPISKGRPVGDSVVGIAADPACNGYIVYTSSGHLYNFGCAPFLGSPVSAHEATSGVIGASFTPDGHGYWAFTKSGEVLPFGDATVYAAGPNSGVVAAAGAA